MAVLVDILHNKGEKVKPLCFLSKTKALKRPRAFFEVLGYPWNAPARDKPNGYPVTGWTASGI
jgi:hypothetical protein